MIPKNAENQLILGAKTKLKCIEQHLSEVLSDEASESTDSKVVADYTKAIKR